MKGKVNIITCGRKSISPYINEQDRVSVEIDNELLIRVIPSDLSKLELREKYLIPVGCTINM